MSSKEIHPVVYETKGITTTSIDIYENIPEMYRKQLEASNYEIVLVDESGEEIIKTNFDSDHFLGAGLFGTVIETADHQYAIKIPFPQRSSINYKEVFANEQELHKKIVHPNIARSLPIYKVRIGKLTLPCLVTEKLSISLFDKIQKTNPDNINENLVSVLKMIGEISSVTQYIYEQTSENGEDGEIITDLTPENIRYDEINNSWKLFDLGETAKKGRTVQAGFDKKYTDPDLTAIGVTDKINERAKLNSMVYSLSLICWQSLTGKDIPDDINIIGINNLITQEKIPEPIFKIIQAGLKITNEPEIKSPLDFYEKITTAYENTQEQS